MRLFTNFLSRLCGGEASHKHGLDFQDFLSRLCGGEVICSIVFL